jgi:hypothetical protein
MRINIATLKGDMPTGPRLGRILGRLDDDRRGLRAMAAPLADATNPGDRMLHDAIEDAAETMLTAILALSDALAMVNEPGEKGFTLPGPIREAPVDPGE